MSEINEIRRAKDIGYKGWARFIWHACEKCGKCRWVQYNQLIAGRHRLCFQCANLTRVPRGEKSPNWKGGRHLLRGYVYNFVDIHDFYFTMSSKAGYVPEHRLVMAKYLGRCLQTWEVVHHKNGIKSDNRIENLELTIRNQHSTDHNKGYRDGYTKGFTDGRSARIKQLESKVKELEKKLGFFEVDLGGKK